MGKVGQNRQHHNRGRAQYHKSRAVGCWNCGLLNHVSRDCTANKAPRCAVCRKRGVQTDRCQCKGRNKNSHRGEYDYERKQTSSPRSSDPVEPATLVTVHNKQVKAMVNTSAQESRMGMKVYSLVEARQKVNPRKKLIKTAYGIELVRTVVITIGVRANQKYPVEVVIDEKIPENEMSLGMPALKTLGYRITVAGRETRERPVVKRLSKGIVRREREHDSQKSRLQQFESDNEDDKISFLDEREAQRIREWQY